MRVYLRQLRMHSGPALARSQRITAVELFGLGVVDELFDAAGAPDGQFLVGAGAALARAVARAVPGDRRVARFQVVGP